jgi:hypothetical protein
MLIGQVGGNAENGYFVNIAPSEFTELQNRFDQLESMAALNVFTRHIALSNGANLGVLQESLTATSEIMNLTMRIGKIEDIDAWQGCYDIEFGAKVFAATESSTLVYDRFIRVNISIACELYAANEIYPAKLILPTPLWLDRAPGANSNLGLDRLKEGVEAIKDSLDHVEALNLSIPIKSFCFIPTVSSLGMPFGTPLSTSTPNGGAAVSRWSASNDNSEISPFTGLPEFNQEHVSINPRIVNIITSELESSTIGGIGLELSAGQVYNFGRAIPSNNVSAVTETPRSIDQDLVIKADAQMWVNRDAEIGYRGNGNPLNGKPQLFTVLVPGVNCAGDKQADVLVEPGGVIRVGQYNDVVRNAGQLRFGANSTLTVQSELGVVVEKLGVLAIENGAQAEISSGASIKLEESSKMFIRHGGRLTVKSGGVLLIDDGASCVVALGGQLIVEPGGIVQISNPQSNVTVEAAGEFILKPGALLRLWDGAQDDGEAYLKIQAKGLWRIEGEFNLSGNGYIWLQGEGMYSQGPVIEDLRSEIHFSGHAKTCRLFLIDKALLKIDNKPLRLENLQVSFADGSIVADNIPVRVNQVNFENVQGAGSTAITVKGGTFLYVRNTDFLNLATGMDIIDHLGSVGALPMLQDSRFTDCQRSIVMNDSRQLYLSRCDLIRSPMELTNISNIVSMSGSTVIGKGDVNDMNFSQLNDFTQNWPDDPGISLWDVPNFRMSGGSIQDYKTGIFAPSFSKTNVILTNKATIQGNQVGIFMQGGFRDISAGTIRNYGMVMMDCARMLDNRIGVLGSNVLLQVDAFANSGTQKWPYVRSNHFRLLQGDPSMRRLFYICYDANGYNINNVTARGNFWEGFDNQPFPTWRLYNSAITVGGPPFGIFHQ